VDGEFWREKSVFKILEPKVLKSFLGFKNCSCQVKNKSVLDDLRMLASLAGTLPLDFTVGVLALRRVFIFEVSLLR